MTGWRILEICLSVLGFLLIFWFVPPLIDKFHYWAARKMGLEFDRRRYMYVKPKEKK